MRLHPFLEDKIDKKKVYNLDVFRPSKPSLVKKGFIRLKTYIQSKIVW